MQTKAKPLYATIPYFGKAWSVTFDYSDYDGHGPSASTLSGYGEFPADRFPGVPVVDFSTLPNGAKFPDLPYVSEAHGVQSSYSKYVPLAQYLELVRGAGIQVR